MKTVKSVLRMGLFLAGVSFITACGSLVDPFDGDRAGAYLNGRGAIVAEAVGVDGNCGPITLEEDLGRSAKSITLKGTRPCPLPLMSEKVLARVLEKPAVTFGKKHREMWEMFDARELCIEEVAGGGRVHCRGCSGKSTGLTDIVIEAIG